MNYLIVYLVGLVVSIIIISGIASIKIESVHEGHIIAIVWFSIFWPLVWSIFLCLIITAFVLIKFGVEVEI